MAPELDLSRLPGSMRALVELMGSAAALRLVELRGGVRLCVPRVASAGHWLAEHIGLEALERLVETYAGEELEIPRCVAALRAARDREIAAQAGERSVAELARRYGMTERGVRKVLRREGVRAGGDPRQRDLFGRPPDRVA